MPAPPARRRAALILLALAVSAAFLATPAAAGPRYGGYLFFYFTGEGAATGEQVYLAASRGDDPLRWDELNAGATEERSHQLRDVSHDFVADCVGANGVSRGEGPTAFKSNTENRWYMFIDEFGGRGHVPFQTTDLASGQWQPVASYDLPSSPRHGTVLPVTSAELAGVRAAYS